MTAEETDPIIGRYSQLARATLRGEDISDGDGTPRRAASVPPPTPIAAQRQKRLSRQAWAAATR